MARPNNPATVFNQAIFDKIIERLEGGEPMAAICREPGMPAARTVREWNETVDGVPRSQKGNLMSTTPAQDYPMAIQWKGVPLEDLSHDELLEAAKFSVHELKRVTEDRDRWQRAGNPVEYLRGGG